MGQGSSALRNGGAAMTSKALDATSRTLKEVMRDLHALQVRMETAKRTLSTRVGQAPQGGDLRSKLAYVESRLGLPSGSGQEIMSEIGMSASEANGMTRDQLLDIFKAAADDLQGGGGRRRSKTSCGRVRRRGNHSRKRRN
jgi:hypothetical protein